MIHKLGFSNVRTDSTIIIIIMRCQRCGVAKEYRMTPNQFALAARTQDKEDTWLYTCSGKQ